MKTFKIKTALIVVLISIQIPGKAQWFTNGNTINGTEWFGASSLSIIPVQFKHNATGSDSRFEWYTNNGVERMRLTNNGWLGLNTTNPLARYHQSNGDWLVGSDISFSNDFTLPGPFSVPVTGIGARTMWVESLGAFRTGGVYTTEWNLSNIGQWSFAANAGNIASGNFSAAFGVNSMASGQSAFACGAGGEAQGDNSFVSGDENIVFGSNSAAFGYSEHLEGMNSFAMGHHSSELGLINGDNLLFGTFHTVDNANGTICIGKINKMTDNFYSVAMGCYLHSTKNYNITLGSGSNATSPLLNSLENTLLIGFNSDIPTLIVTPAAGVGYQGKVGIRLTGIGSENPSEALDIDGTIRLRDLNQESPDCILMGQNVLDGGGTMDNRLVRLDLFGSPGTFLANDGSWQTATAVALANNGASISGTTIQFGNPVGSTLAQLINDRQVPMNNFNIVFSEPVLPNAAYNNIGIGLNGVGAEVPSQKLDVDGTARIRQLPTNAPNSIITGVGTGNDMVLNHLAFNGNGNTVLAGNATWVDPNNIVCEWNEVTNGTSDDLVMGYSGACNEGRVGIGTSIPASKFTVNFMQDNTQNGITAHVRSTQQTGNSSGTQNIAGQFQASGRQGNIIGLWGEAAADAAADNSGTDMLVGVVGIASANPGYCFYDQIIGVYGEAKSSCPIADWGGYFVGGLNSTGPTIFASDANLKTDIVELSGSTDYLMHLNPKQYAFNNELYPQMGLGEGTHLGLIAQDIEEVFPDMVEEVYFPEHYDEDGNVTSEGFTYKGLNYIELIPLLIGGFKEQQLVIESQQSLLNTLQEQLNACCSDSKSMTLPQDGSVQDVVLKSGQDESQKAILYQNTPNPHSGQCVIRYYVPEFKSTCEIHFFDSYGSLIKTTSIESAGMGQIHVDAQDLASGGYTYALVIDGDVVATRMMIKQ